MGRIAFVVSTSALLASCYAYGQVSLTSFPSGTYYQDFDSLAASGSPAWSNDVSLDGWYLSRSSYTAATGTAATGSAYSYGSGTSTERALGSLASGTTLTIGYGLRLLNDTASSITEILVSYTGEQWRRANADPHTLEFGYKIGSGLSDPLATGFTLVPMLDFTSPQLGGALALDGNATANRTVISLVVTLNESFDPGEELMLRWNDVDDGGTDHGLAIDDLSVAVPEASPAALLPLAGLAVIGYGWHRRRSDGRL